MPFKFKTLRDFLPRGLFGRTVLIILLPILLLQGAATFIFFDRHWTRMTERLAFSVAGEVAALSEELEAGPDHAAQARTLRELMAKHMNMLVTYTPGLIGQDLASQGNDGFGLEDTLAEALARQVRRPYKVDVDLGHKRIELQVQLKDGLLKASMPQSRMYDSSGYIFILWLNGLALLFFFVSIVFMRNQIRPIRRLAIAAERFGKGADVQPFKPTGAREIRRATQAFFSMKERITRTLAQRTAMLAGISHDLRTPLTRMKLQLAMMQAGPDVDAMHADIEDMETMIEGYLAFMRGEGDELSQKCDLIDLVDRLSQHLQRYDFPVRYDLPTSLVLELRPSAFERAIMNLLDNARKYAHAAALSIQTDKRAGVVHIVLDDDGPGIPPDKYDDAFKPFERLEVSRNRKTGGTGLGLAIAQDIVLSHGGSIALARSPMGGLRVHITLPL